MNEKSTINRFELSSQFITNKADEDFYAIKVEHSLNIFKN